MRHFECLDLNTSRVVAMIFPPTVAHITYREEIHRAIAFAKNNAMVDVGLGKASIDGNV